jgi:putative polyhydroxyalkanoate system protein
MPKLALTLPHSLGKNEATSRLTTLFETVKSKYQGQFSDLEESWEGDRLQFGFKTYGVRIEGAVTVDEERVKLESQIPFAAVMFKGKIESAVRNELTQLLAY